MPKHKTRNTFYQITWEVEQSVHEINNEVHILLYKNVLSKIL